MKRLRAVTEVQRPFAVPLGTAPAVCRLDEQLYAASAEAVLMVDALALTVIEANPRVMTLLGRERAALVGADFASLFASPSRPAIAAGVAAAVEHGYTKARWLSAVGGSQFLDIGLSLVRTGSESYLLVHLQESDLAERPDLGDSTDSSALTLLDTLSDGFFVTDHDLKLTYANRAFAHMTGKASSDALLGDSITRWLDLTQHDLDALAKQMSLRQGVQFLRTSVRQTAQALRRVMLCAIAVPDGQHACWGFRVCVQVEPH